MSELTIISGLTGLDTETIIQQLMEVERQPLVLLTARQAELAREKEAWQQLKSSLDNLASKVSPLTRSYNFYKKSVEVGDTAVLTATASTAAANASYEIKVISLARAQVIQSGAYLDPDASLGLSGTVSVNGKDVVVSTEDSLNSLAAKINGTADVGAQASVVQLRPGEFRLLLTSAQTGTANQLVLGGDTTIWQQLGFVNELGEVNEIVAASDAVFTVNGVQFQRSSNVISDVIQGVTLNLKMQADPVTGAGGTTIVTVDWDDSSLVQQIKDLVAAYNAFIDTAAKYNAWNAETREGGVLFGDPLLQRLLAEIKKLIYDQVEGSTAGYESAPMVGISTGPLGAFSREGKLSFDETKFTEKLESNRDALVYLFTSSKGLASSIAQLVSKYTRLDGYLDIRMKRLTDEDRRISDRIEDVKARLDMRLAALRRQFTTLEMTLAKMSSLSLWLAQQINGLAATAGGSSTLG